MRAAIAAEAAGTPSVSIVCSGFERQALATGRGLGFDALPLAVLRGHVDALDYNEMIRRFIEHTIPEIVSGLTIEKKSSSTTSNEPTATDIVFSGSIDEVHETFAFREWSDGLPIIPPTVERVQNFLAESGHDPWRVLGIAKSSGRDMTVWSVAVNAVMAGCLPEQLPVLLALAEVMADPNYGVEHSGNTTGADAQIILNGPCVRELNFNHGTGALRDGVAAANTAVARWFRLYLRNVCAITPSEHDKATFGNASHVVLAEDEACLAEIGWPSIAVDLGGSLGITANDDAVTVARMNGGTIIGSVFGSSPEEIIPYLADGLMRIAGWELTHVYGLGHGEYRPLLVLSPLLARLFGKAGWSKPQVQAALFENARMPAWRFEKLIGEWSNLTAGRRTLTELVHEGHLPNAFAESTDPNRLVPIVTEPSKIQIAVAGDPNRTNAYVMSNDGTHGRWTTKRVDRTASLDLVCQVPDPSHQETN